jgi:glucokinase
MAAARLLAAIDAVRVRFALLRPGGNLAGLKTYATAEFDGFEAAVRGYLTTQLGERPIEAAIAVACPVLDDHVAVRDGWTFSLERSMQALHLSVLHACNDLVAVAMAVPRLAAAETKKLGGASVVPNTPIAVIAPAASLSVAALVPTGTGAMVPVTGEAGHSSFSAVSKRERQIAEVLSERFGHVAAERVISAPGIVSVYEAICRLERVTAVPRSPAEAIEAGLTGRDPQCAEALDVFCAALGGFAGDTVLTLGARGGLYLAGDLLDQLGAYFSSSAFRRRFEEKGDYSGYLAAIPSFLIQHQQPALLGLRSFFAQ